MYITGDEPGDAVGSSLSVLDLDGDGRAELVVDEPLWSARAGPVPHTAAVHVLSGLESGIASALPGAHFTAVMPGGVRTFGLARETALWIQGGTRTQTDSCTNPVYAGVTTGDVSPDQRLGCVTFDELGGAPFDLTECFAAGVPAVCASTISLPDDPPFLDSGAVQVVPVPIVGEVRVGKGLARYEGDPGDVATRVVGTADVAGSGSPDLVVGASGADGVGRVAVVHTLPAGVRRLWDITDTTLSGETEYGRFGMHVKVGDLDGDGASDVLVWETGTVDQRLYVFRGPIPPGDHLASGADWTFSAGSGEFVGDAAIGDFDGDGRPDLAVGAGPFGGGPGSVHVYRSPATGPHGPSEAVVELASGVGVADGFGAALDAGDLDGDGRDDLAAGAYWDPVLGHLTGSVLVFPGGGLP